MAYTGLWSLVAQSDAVTLLVLVTLLGMSVIGWAIFFYKLMTFSMSEKYTAVIAQAVERAFMLSDIERVARSIQHTSIGALVVNYMRTAAEKGDVSSEAQAQRMYSDSDAISVHDEQYLPFLAASAALGPLLGLFGTVWGLVHAFMRISQQQSADIATVAPGIAEALVTTLAGLIVAMPALALYHYLSVRAKALEHKRIRIIELLLTHQERSGHTAGVHEGRIPEQGMRL